MTTEPEENVTDASPSRTEPAEPDTGLGPSGGGPGDAAHDGAPQPPRWSDRQPAPAPWFVGRPGAGPAPQGEWPAAMPQRQPEPPHPASADSAGEDGGRESAEGGGPQSPGGDGPRSAAGPEDQPSEKQEAPVAPPRPPQNPYGRPGPYGPPAPPAPPWQDPNRYGPQTPRQQRPEDPWQRRQQPPRPERQQDKPVPLDLRTRWARGMALGAVVCTVASIWYSISNFPTWMVGAGAGLVLGLTGLWLAVFAQRAAAARGKRAPEAVGAIVWSSIASLLSLMILAFSLIFYTQLSQLSHCMRSATTISAQKQCETNFQNDFGTRG